MRKILITVIMAMLFVMPAHAYTRADFESIYHNETDQNIKEMGIRQLELELGINTGSNKRTVGHFTRSDCDFCTMTSLINTKKQTVSGRTETDFTMYLSKDNVYDYAYYKEREKDLDLLVAHIGVVKAMTQGMSDIEKATFIHDYIADRFQYDTEGSINSAVQGFKTGYTECTGYTAAYYILGLNCGLKVRAQSGTTQNGGLHTFNIVTIDGQDLAVDVTNDDAKNNKEYMLIPLQEYIATSGILLHKDSLSCIG